MVSYYHTQNIGLSINNFAINKELVRSTFVVKEESMNLWKNYLLSKTIVNNYWLVCNHQVKSAFKTLLF